MTNKLLKTAAARQSITMVRNPDPRPISPTQFTPRAPTLVTSPFLDDVLRGLSARRKNLPSKYFYDAEGSRLFEAICELPEYYLTRTETALLERVAPVIAASIADDAALVEFGSGASAKTRLLLDASPQIGLYVPIDISEPALSNAAQTIRSRYPNLTVIPLVEDFTRALQLPSTVRGRPIVGFFPGSSSALIWPRYPMYSCQHMTTPME
jgi:uncharacterized SAM-dependent methyltransferase